MKPKLILPLLILISLVSVFALSLFWWRANSSAPSKNQQEVRFIIKKGAGASSIGNNLAKEHLIKNAFAFKLFVQIKGLTKSIPPGEFEIPQNLSLPQVVSLLLKGPQGLWVTIPEGLRRQEIAEKYIETLSLKGQDAENFYQEFLNTSEGLEGYLFPDTYLVPKDITASKAVNLMYTTFSNKFDNQPTKSLTSKEVVILASILERETVTDEERPIVAGILIKRLKNDWPLQADATIQYALGKKGNWWPKPLTKDDINLNSPYNTYKNLGLPPTPIANPGLSSLNAAANPQDSDYWYYIHDTSGKIHYAQTLEEHNLNVQKYLK